MGSDPIRLNPTRNLARIGRSASDSRKISGWVGSSEEVDEVAAEDLIDFGRRHSSITQARGDLWKLLVVSQDRPEVGIEVSPDGHMADSH